MGFAPIFSVRLFVLHAIYTVYYNLYKVDSARIEDTDCNSMSTMREKKTFY
jgi:hypothetical protein